MTPPDQFERHLALLQLSELVRINRKAPTVRAVPYHFKSRSPGNGLMDDMTLLATVAPAPMAATQLHLV